MKTFMPASPKVESGGLHLRKRILESYYTLSQHAADQMAKRGVTMKEVINCIRSGRIGAPSKQEIKTDFLCVTFWHGNDGQELIVPVRSKFGDYDAKPIILTAYRNSREDYVPEGEIDDLVEHVVVEQVVIRAPDEMTDEELEAELLRRRNEKAKRARQGAEARLNELASEKARLTSDRNVIERKLKTVDEEISKLEQELSPRQLPAHA
jgi:hypothetical protein